MRHAEYGFVSDENPPAPTPALPAPRSEFVGLQPRDDFRHVDGVLFSPDGRYLAIADQHFESFGCVGTQRTTVWLYETATWRATVVRPLGFGVSEWAFAEDGSALVLSSSAQSNVDPGPEAIDLLSGATIAASIAPLARLASTAESGALRATSRGPHVHVARNAKPWLSLGPPVAAVVAGGALPSGEVFFAARWPNGSFALWDVERSRAITMDPPPPARVTGVAVEEDVLLLAGRDGSFWRYQPGLGGVFDGQRVRRNDPLVLTAFDVRGFAGREKTGELGMVGLLGGDPDTPLSRGPAVVSCGSASCGFHVDDDNVVRVFASDQPGQVSAWDGSSAELFGGDAGDAFLCTQDARVVEMERCRDALRTPRLFTQARRLAEARTRLAPL